VIFHADVNTENNNTPWHHGMREARQKVYMPIHNYKLYVNLTRHDQ